MGFPHKAMCYLARLWKNWETCPSYLSSAWWHWSCCCKWPIHWLQIHGEHFSLSLYSVFLVLQLCCFWTKNQMLYPQHSDITLGISVCKFGLHINCDCDCKLRILYNPWQAPLWHAGIYVQVWFYTWHCKSWCACSWWQNTSDWLSDYQGLWISVTTSPCS
jgi:hypothetical protein